MAAKSTRPRERRRASDDVLERILESAAIQFAAVGFEGASTRTIAEQAGVHQAQINYHVGSKAELWRAVVDFLFARLRTELDRALPADLDDPSRDPIQVFEDVIRLHVGHTANHPELSRIMLIESAKASDRVSWLLTNHVRPTLAALELLWADVRAAGGGRDIAAHEVFMMMIGLAPTPFAQAALLRPLLGAESCTPERHARTMTEWIMR